MVNQPILDKNSRDYCVQMVNSGRSFLLWLLLLSVVNLVLLLLDAGYYLLFSASVPYFLTQYGIAMDYMETGALGTFTVTALVISAVILAAYLLCWLFSKKHSGWLIVASVLFVIDTVALVLLCLVSNAFKDSLLDLAFHAYVLFVLIRGVVYAHKLKGMEQDSFDSGELTPTPELD